ncbi:MAG: SGNH/GDSL hydrolase family protein [Planctomycetes bacterium]|nr:SGNH/GDSL hydrolase family protein [Planctomycetota bacterium]
MNPTPIQSNATAQRTPPYALIALVLFGLSLGALGVSAWLVLKPAPETGFRRGYTPLTNETNLPKVWLPDPDLEHRLGPGVDFTFKNEDGISVNYRSVPVGANGVCFRDDGINGEVFAIAVGDSFTFGHDSPLEECWVERLEKSLGADVVNLGVTNVYGSTQIQRTLEIHGMQYKPRLIIWAAFTNDWCEDTIFLSWEKIARPLKGQLIFQDRRKSTMPCAEIFTCDPQIFPAKNRRTRRWTAG